MAWLAPGSVCAVDAYDGYTGGEERCLQKVLARGELSRNSESPPLKVAILWAPSFRKVFLKISHVSPGWSGSSGPTTRFKGRSHLGFCESQWVQSRVQPARSGLRRVLVNSSARCEEAASGGDPCAGESVPGTAGQVLAAVTVRSPRSRLLIAPLFSASTYRLLSSCRVVNGCIYTSTKTHTLLPLPISAPVLRHRPSLVARQPV